MDASAAPSPGHYTVGRLAALAGVTVRTLHHFDAIGLLSPSGRSAAGYREYDDADLARLREVLLWRELGFPLDRISELVASQGTDRAALLLRQEQLLRERAARLVELAGAIGREREAGESGLRLSAEERIAVFGRLPVQEWAEEAEERWGSSPAYAESRRRTASYDRRDWERITGAGAELDRRLAAALVAGVPPDDPAAMDLAEEHRQAIDATFYPRDHVMHCGLADMYVADDRFAARYEAVEPGLTAYLQAVIRANAARHSEGGD